MEQTESTKIITVSEVDPILQAITASKGELDHFILEPLNDLLESKGPLFPYTPNVEEALWHPVVVLHSSGSTGLPRPVVMRHGSFTIMDNDRKFPKVEGRKSHDITIWDFDGTPGRIYEPFPPFHSAGFQTKVMVPLYTNAIPVFGPSLRPPSGALSAEIIRTLKVRGCLLPPSVAEQLLHETDGRKCFQQLDIFCFAGGPLSPVTGDTISQLTMISQFYGSTELSQVRQLVPRPAYWSYMEFHPLAKLEFEPFDDESFELVVRADEDTKEHLALNYTYPEASIWHTKDLFKPHPTEKGLWRFHGRKDDVLVLSNGEKLNPVLMESQLQSLPDVSGALITGTGHFQPALILELRKSVSIVEEEAELDESLWAAIESANAVMPAHGRVVRSLVLIASAEKPFIRAGKGTVVRKLTEDLYSQEIRDLYARQSQSKPLKKVAALSATAFTLDAVKSLVRSIIPTGPHTDSIKDNDDLYIFGMDSLKTVEALVALRSALLAHRNLSQLSWLTSETFYRNPTITQLSQLILSFLNDGVVPEKPDRVAKMSKLFEQYSRFLPFSSSPPSIREEDRNLSVAVTGTTGILGSHLLECLSEHPRISKIFCLNRSSKTQHGSLETQNSKSDAMLHDGKKLRFLTVDLVQDKFGLADADWSEVTKECDFILHVAWKVDFNQSLSSFIENIESLLPLVAWSSSSPRRPRIVFLSSISSVGPWNSTYCGDKAIPEASIQDLGASLAIGYSESKQIAERLLEKAASRSKIPISIIRSGQIGGSSTSASAPWTQRDIIPAILKTSKALGLLPSDLPPVDWIPVDVMASIVLEISLNDARDKTNTTKYYNVINPQPVPWEQFVPQIKRYYSPETEVVTLLQWVEKLLTFNVSDLDEWEAKPALKLYDFLSIIACSGPTSRWQTSASLRASKTLAALPPVDSRLMGKWLDQILVD